MRLADDPSANCPTSAANRSASAEVRGKVRTESRRPAEQRLAEESAAKTLLGAGIEPESSTTEELKAFTITETEKWAKIMKTAGIEPE